MGVIARASPVNGWRRALSSAGLDSCASTGCEFDADGADPDQQMNIWTALRCMPMVQRKCRGAPTSKPFAE
jgi:hypothetical protein